VILLSALVLGLLAGWGWAHWQERAYRAPNLRLLILVPAAFLPQLVVAFLPATRGLLPSWLESGALPGSLFVFLAFVWVNRRLPGMPVLIAGLVLNLLVITLNGGWMPISPETASHLASGTSVEMSSPGSRFGQKDVLLLPGETRLALLADRFLLPDWIHYQVAFSLGDILVAVGVFWLLASGGSPTGPLRGEP
jgi:hypothetical protein